MTLQLTSDQRKTLTDLEVKIKELQANLALAEKAGIDVSAMKEALKAADASRRLLLQHLGGRIT